MPDMSGKQPTYRLTLRVQADPVCKENAPLERLPEWVGVPAETRLKRALKLLLRCYGLVCLKIEEQGEGEAQD